MIGTHLTHQDPFQQLPAADDDSRGSPSSYAAARQDPAGAGPHRQPTSKRLASISGFGPGSSSTKETARAKRTIPRNAKSAQEIIREAQPSSSFSIPEIGIKQEGGDTPALPTHASQSPRSPQSSAASPNAIDRINNGAPPRPNHHLPTPLKFLKPAGVDEPPPSEYVARRDRERPAQQQEANIVDCATQRRPNLKRDIGDRRGASSGNGDGGSSGAPSSDRDRKRKKSGAPAAAAAS